MPARFALADRGIEEAKAPFPGLSSDVLVLVAVLRVEPGPAALASVFRRHLVAAFVAEVDRVVLADVPARRPLPCVQPQGIRVVVDVARHGVSP
ncbi:hypothetical protein THIOKS13280004 [Thiocapsa sp. KS1]|nr:hypothetical protein THIOKS13280004 [Thiocapsa sp. KS1]